MSEVEKVVKKWPKDVLVAFVVEHAAILAGARDDAGALELWRLNRELREAGSEVQSLRERQQAALARNDFAGFESIERLLRGARKRESDAYHELMSIYDMRQARRDFERSRAKATARPAPVASRELALVSPPRASDPDVLDAEFVDDEAPALPKPRLGLPAPRRSLPMQQRRK